MTISDSFKLNEFADHNFKFDENGREITKLIENTVGKGEIALYEQFLLFAQCFQKTRTADTQKSELVWERVDWNYRWGFVDKFLKEQWRV